MTAELARKAARMLTVGFDGRELGSELETLIERGVGGVVLFGRNVESPRQVLELTRSIKRLAGRPIFVAIDQEGGRVRRLRGGFTPVPAMRVLGNSGDARLARSVGGLLGRELSAVGVDLNFAPVVDVDTNPENPVIGDRSFGRDPTLVARMGRAFIEGLQQAGVAACAKHFPGHGDTLQDSHLELPRVCHDRARLDRVELPPFQSAVKVDVASVMTAHVVMTALDPGRPATMSSEVIEGLLRRDLGFEGVVFSDDTEMRAIADHFGVEEAAVLAARAGVDSILVCHTAERAHRSIDALILAMSSGELDPRRIEGSQRRLHRLLDKYAAPPRIESDLGVLACPEHLELVASLRPWAGEASRGHDPTEYPEPGEATGAS